ncbi:MAG: hypothetical protein AAFN77_00605 [Planctomycetota bacterium]
MIDEIAYQLCLLEMSKRKMVAELNRHAQAMRKRRIKEIAEEEDFEEDREFESTIDFDFDVMIALRKAEGLSAPVIVDIEQKAKNISCNTIELPDLKCWIANVDSKKQTIQFNQGGDYRSGKQTRFHVQVTDAKGVSVKPKSVIGVVNVGGLMIRSRLEPGESWDTTLELRKYVPLLPPGKYSLQIFYHNESTIADISDLEGLVVAKSPVIELQIERLKVSVSDIKRKTICDLIAKIDQTKEPRIVAGTYGEWAHKLVPPTSASGKILLHGYDAIPVLIDQLQIEESAELRNRILCLLFSLTGQYDPRPWKSEFASPLGHLDAADSGWAIVSNSGKSLSFGLSTTTDDPRKEVKPDYRNQAPFINAWKSFDKFIERIELPASNTTGGN